jgi:F-type H+-transporting ATPase subunit delta
MAAKDPRIQGYATALFRVAEAEGVLDRIEDELYRFARALEREVRLRDALTDINLPAEHRAKMVEELLGDKASPHTRNIISFIVQQGRAREIGAIIDALAETAAAERQRAIAEVRTAVELDDAQQQKLKDALQKATGKAVELKVIQDPSVVGGFVARVGDMVFDASVRRRLELAREGLGRA